MFNDRRVLTAMKGIMNGQELYQGVSVYMAELKRRKKTSFLSTASYLLPVKMGSWWIPSTGGFACGWVVVLLNVEVVSIVPDVWA